MREVIKYSKNYKTGEVVTEHVMKKPQLMRNTAKIEIVNAETGEIEQEAYTENAVSEQYEAWAYQAIYDSLLNSTAGMALGNYSKAQNRATHMFQTIILTDSDTPDMEDEYFMHGQLIAFANIDNTSVNSTRVRAGAFNRTESFVEITDDYLVHVHRVYDWPTNSGNGTIRSIYWPFATVDTGYSNSGGYQYLENLNYDVSHTACGKTLIKQGSTYSGYEWSSFMFNGGVYRTTDIFFDKHGNTYLLGGSHTNNAGQYFKCLNQEKFFIAGHLPEFESTPSFYKEIDIQGFYYELSMYDNAGNNSNDYKDYEKLMVVTKYDYAGNQVDQWEVDCISDSPMLVEKRDNGWLVRTISKDTFENPFKGYFDQDGWVGVQMSFTTHSTKDYYFPEVNEDNVITNATYTRNRTLYAFYNVITKQWLYTPDPSDYVSIASISNTLTQQKPFRKVDGWQITTGIYKIKLLNGKYQYRNIPKQVSSVNYANHYSDYMHIDRMHSEMNYGICYIYSNPTYRICKLMPIGAHTRLPNAITKNSMNTMKVQYDFYFRIPADVCDASQIWMGYED
jgi:hypothetical protein